MRSFEELTMHVTARQAAEAYGLKPDRRGMVRCIFHLDKEPSMKVDERFYCFGCGHTGDAIDLTAQLFGSDLREAAEKLAEDFGLTGLEYVPDKRKGSGQKAASEKKASQDEIRNRKLEFYKDILLFHLRLLRHFKDHYPPTNMDEEWDDLFALALNKMPVIEYRLDILFFGTEKEQTELIQEMERGDGD